MNDSREDAVVFPHDLAAGLTDAGFFGMMGARAVGPAPGSPLAHESRTRTIEENEWLKN